MPLNLVIAVNQASAPAFDPANYWVAVVTAAGIYALTSFPLWDRIGTAMREGRDTPNWLYLCAVVGIVLPLAAIWMALDQLSEDPVPAPAGSATFLVPFTLIVAFFIRCFFPLFLSRTDSEDTAGPSPAGPVPATTGPVPASDGPAALADGPAAQRRRRRLSPWVAGLAGLACGAVLRGRRTR